MPKQWMLLLALALCLPGAARAGTDGSTVFHLPPADAEAGQALELELEPGQTVGTSALAVYYRRAGEERWKRAPVVRDTGGKFLAAVPGDDVVSPGLEYYIAGDQGPFLGPRFASPEAPYLVRVEDTTGLQVFQRRLDAYQGRRSLARLGGGYVDFGTRRSATEALPDRWWLLYADFTYRILGVLDTLRFGAVRLRGTTVEGGLEPLEALTPVLAGYDYGFAELGLRLHDDLGIYGELQLGANATGFTAGGRGSLRIGPDTDTHLRLWAGNTIDVGFTAGLTLVWTTVPKVPMAATIEVTNWPAVDAGAVRLLYQATFDLGGGLFLQPRVSYQARGAHFGGLGIESRLGLAF